MSYAWNDNHEGGEFVLGFYNYTTWLTYLGLLSGVTGIMSAACGNEFAAIICLALSGFFDLFDGKVASTKKNRTEDMKKFGIQIDSLSDLVCFCVLPAVILLSLAARTLSRTSPLWFTPIGCAIVLAGLIRLAYFNVSEEHRQKEESGLRKSYNGIPVTVTSVAIPFFLAIYKILFTIFGNAGTADRWALGYLIFYCFELLFFAFGFLFKGFRVMKVHGKKMLIPLLIGMAAVAAICILFIMGKAG